MYPAMYVPKLVDLVDAFPARDKVVSKIRRLTLLDFVYYGVSTIVIRIKINSS